MKVKISFTVEVDPEGWDELYGTGTDPKTVREDVRNYFTNYVPESPPGQDGVAKLVRG